MKIGSFYWILVAPIDAVAQWQPARYTGLAGDSIGETWDYIGLLSADGHHHVDVFEVGEEICRDATTTIFMDSYGSTESAALSSPAPFFASHNSGERLPQREPAEGAGEALCEDCPPVGYPTDETRCAPCPRRINPS
jgi:hypothetical protein